MNRLGNTSNTKDKTATETHKDTRTKFRLYGCIQTKALARMTLCQARHIAATTVSTY